MEQQHQNNNNPSQNRRLMQVKVLYTFNDDPKSNCLARCPQALSIQTAHLDPTTEIGVIELRTCIQAIAAASPELVAKLGQDYTVYAYDYSEYETPLVGQGMLSYILAAASTTPNAPAHQSRTLVTGRVSKNAFALFSAGAAEVLEVKLKLIPVPCDLQNVYLENMEKYRSPSTLNGATVQSVDAAAWQSLLNPSPELGHGSLTFPSPPTMPYIASQSQPQYSPEPNAQPYQHTTAIAHPQPQPAYFSPTHHTLNPSTESRPTTPLQRSSEIVAASRKRVNPPSRPSSRASNAGARRPTLNKSQPCASRVENNADTSEAEDGPKPKRARVTQTDWNGSSNFGAARDSLRVTAATAASIRGHRPFLGNPLTSDIVTTESGERPPTPRPAARISRPLQKRQSMAALSFPGSLADTLNDGDSPPISYHPVHNHDPLGILADSSPEKNDVTSVDSSPLFLRSSPPIMRSPSPSPRRHSILAHFEDSGFASGNLDEYMPNADDLKIKNNDYEQNLAALLSEAPTQPLATIEIPAPKAPAPPDPMQLGQRIAPAPAGYVPPSSPVPALRKRQPKSRTQSISRAPAKSKSGQAVDQADVLLSAALSDGSRMRSESCLTDGESIAGGENGQPPKWTKSTASHERKKQAIQSRLAESVRAGELPRFCKNCGEINTPSWRKWFVKIVNGPPLTDSPAADSKEKVWGWEPVEKDAEGNVTVHRFSKSLLEVGDEGYEMVELCNSCGIWVQRNMTMRPQAAWAEKEPPKPRQRSYAKKGQKSTAKDGQSDGIQTNDPMESIERDSESRSPADTSTVAVPAPTQKKPGYTTRLPRASSAGPMNQPAKKNKNAASQAALERAIQSSPPRFPGSKHSPIELDNELSPEKPTKRLLFPSPRKAGETKSLDPEADKRPSPTSIKPSKQKCTTLIPAGNEENERPADSLSDDELDHLLNDDDQASANNLATPTKRVGQSSKLLKTPIRSARRTPLGSKGTTTPGGRNRAFSNPATPSRPMLVAELNHLTPQDMTPWTAQMYSMLSDANQDVGNNAWPGIDDGGIFNFSDFSTSDPNGGAFAMYEHETGGEFWNSSEGIDGFLGGQQAEQQESPKGTTTEGVLPATS